MRRWCGAVFSLGLSLSFSTPLNATELDTLLDLKGVTAASASIGDENFVAGTLTREDSVPITSRSLFQIGSVTKNFIAALVLQLVGEGLLDLDTEVISPWPNVTLRQLLGMTSGIPDYAASTALRQAWLKNPSKRWSARELVAYVASQPLEFRPGSLNKYSNTNYILLGMEAERVTGKPLGSLLRERLFEPLALQDTYYEVAPADQMVHGYSELGSPLVPPVPPNIDVTNLNLSIAGAAGAMISTPQDLVTWFQSLLSGAVLRPEQLKEMQTLGPGGLFGLGIAFLEMPDHGPVWFMGGETAGYVAMLAYLPESNHARALCLNSTPQGFRPLRTLLQLEPASVDTASGVKDTSY